MLIIPEKHTAEEILQDEQSTEQDIERDVETDVEKMSSEDVLKELRLDEKTFPCDVLEGDWL